MLRFWKKQKPDAQIMDLPFPPSGFVDLHCHCLAGVDDGPESTEQALALAHALVDDGVRVVAATPHQLGSMGTQLSPIELRTTVQRHQELYLNEGIPLHLVAGGEVHIDEDLLGRLQADQVLSLADGSKYILLEMPSDVFYGIRPLQSDLKSEGLTVILAHPERNRAIMREPQRILDWLTGDTILQITAISITGELGPAAQRTALTLLEMPLRCIVASDAHRCDFRPPRMRQAYQVIARAKGLGFAYKIFTERPMRLLTESGIAGLDPYAAGPVL